MQEKDVSSRSLPMLFASPRLACYISSPSNNMCLHMFCQLSSTMRFNVIHH